MELQPSIGPYQERDISASSKATKTVHIHGWNDGDAGKQICHKNRLEQNLPGIFSRISLKVALFCTGRTRAQRIHLGGQLGSSVGEILLDHIRLDPRLCLGLQSRHQSHAAQLLTGSQQGQQNNNAEARRGSSTPLHAPLMDDQEEIIFVRDASGVLKKVSGDCPESSQQLWAMRGASETPSYEQVCSGRTGHRGRPCRLERTSHRCE